MLRFGRRRPHVVRKTVSPGVLRGPLRRRRRPEPAEGGAAGGAARSPAVVRRLAPRVPGVSRLHLFARHFTRLRTALSTIRREGELEYVSAARLEHSLTRLLRVVRSRAHHWRTFCARPAIGSTTDDDDVVMIDQEDKEDDASLADASDGDEVAFERGHCGSTTLLEIYFGGD